MLSNRQTDTCRCTRSSVVQPPEFRDHSKQWKGAYIDNGERDTLTRCMVQPVSKSLGFYNALACILGVDCQRRHRGSLATTLARCMTGLASCMIPCTAKLAFAPSYIWELVVSLQRAQPIPNIIYNLSSSQGRQTRHVTPRRRETI